VVATISRILKIIGLFCKRALQKRLYYEKETYNFKEPTSRCHPIFARGSSVEGEVGGWGRDPKKMYGKRLGDGVEYHLMKPTPRR